MLINKNMSDDHTIEGDDDNVIEGPWGDSDSQADSDGDSEPQDNDEAPDGDEGGEEDSEGGEGWPPEDVKTVQRHLDKVTDEIEREGSGRENAIKVIPLIDYMEADPGTVGKFIAERKAEWNSMSLAEQRSKLRLDRGMAGEILAFLAKSSLATNLPYMWGDVQESMYATLLYCGMAEFKLDEVPQGEWDTLRQQFVKKEGRFPSDEELRFAMNEKLILEGPYTKDKGREWGAEILLTIAGWLAKSDPKMLALLAMGKPILASKRYGREVATEVRHIRHDPSKEYERVRVAMEDNKSEEAKKVA